MPNNNNTMFGDIIEQLPYKISDDNQKNMIAHKYIMYKIWGEHYNNKNNIINRYSFFLMDNFNDYLKGVFPFIYFWFSI